MPSPMRISAPSRRIALRAIAAGATLALCSCASTSNFANALTGYSNQARDMRQALVSGDPSHVQGELAFLDSRCRSADQILYLSERGRIRSLSGDRAGSIADYQIASDAFENRRMKAVISASETFFAASSLASNDLAIPYDGQGFEKVMLHNLQALNYLLDGNQDFARIELNRADVEQSYSLEAHAKLAQKAESTRRQENIDLSSSMEQLRSRTSLNSFGDASLKNSFQNALTFYLRGTLFEDEGSLDKALIEYKKALDIFPANETVAESAMRVAKRVGNRREQSNIRNISGFDAPGYEAPEGSGHVVIIFEQGFISSRSTLRIPFLWDDTILQVALPYYNVGGYPNSAALEVTGAGINERTQGICNLDAMAIQSLKEDYPSILLRQVLRLIAKHEMQKEADKQGFGILMQITNIVTDRADDRNWLTLPATVQVSDFFLPAGQHMLNCRYMGLSDSISIDIRENRTHYVLVTQLGQRLLIQSGDSL
ncbi:MAG: hypothetical protein JW942_01250 [Opitutales bacterium]|nr:hypothetical protein [Opitutales bacterium]